MLFKHASECMIYQYAWNAMVPALLPNRSACSLTAVERYERSFTVALSNPGVLQSADDVHGV